MKPEEMEFEPVRAFNAEHVARVFGVDPAALKAGSMAKALRDTTAAVQTMEATLRSSMVAMAQSIGDAFKDLEERARETARKEATKQVLAQEREKDPGLAGVPDHTLASLFHPEIDVLARKLTPTRFRIR